MSQNKDKAIREKIKQVNDRRREDQGKTNSDAFKGVRFTPEEKARMNRNNGGK